MEINQLKNFLNEFGDNVILNMILRNKIGLISEENLKFL